MMNLFNILVTNNDLATKCFVCGKQELPYQLSVFGHNAITIFKIIVPIILILLGVIDMVKAITAQKEDEIKKAQQTFVRRLIAALIIFFVIVIVQFVFNILSKAGFAGDFTGCLNAFINGNATEIKCSV